ncbi:MAG: hypothetical protein KKC05_04105 [Nanoarchaeota archaeon]|nr:hypothetical protein [Nanoarchaeota archaeon]
MSIFFHGTPYENGLQIAERGAFLSPWQKYFEFYKHVREGGEIDFIRLSKAYVRRIKKMSDDELEEIALIDATQLWGGEGTLRIAYVGTEEEKRVKTISFTPSMAQARGYAGNVGEMPGIVLGVELTDQMIREKVPKYKDGHVLFYPKTLDLADCSPVSLELIGEIAGDYEDAIQESFSDFLNRNQMISSTIRPKPLNI